MTASPTTPQIFSAVDNKTGLPLAGGQLFTYQSGTNTYQAAYSDSALTEPLANPILLDNYGQSVFYLNPALSYRFNLLNTGGTQQAHYPQDNIVMAISANTSNVWSQLQTFNGGAVAEGVELGAPGPGGLSVSATGGLIIQGTAGSADDLTVKNNAGTPILSVPIGGAEPYFPIGVQGMTVGVGSVSVTGATGTAGQMFYESQNGLAVQAKTGSVNDFMLLQPSGTTDVMRVPTGTQNLVVEGQVSSAQFNGSGAGLTSLPGTAAGARFKNLQVSYGQNTGIVTLTCDECVVSDLVGGERRLTSIAYPALANGTLSATLATVGAIGGTDGSTQTVGSFYTVFVGFNGTAVGLLISAEPTGSTTPINGPVAPISGYTQYACASINKIKAAGVWLPGIQNGSEFTHTVGTYLTGLPTFLSGTAAIGSTTVPTYVAQTVRGNGSFVPSHASGITIGIPFLFGSGATLAIAPNNSYGAISSTTNPAPLMFFQGADSWITFNTFYRFNLESNSLWACSTAGQYYSVVIGWTVNI